MTGDTETDRQSDTQTGTERCSWLGTQGQTDRVTHRLTQRGVVGWGHRDTQTDTERCSWLGTQRHTD